MAGYTEIASEALSGIVVPVTLAVEQSVYGWTYADAACNWGHREGMMWTRLTEDYGAGGTEGLMGIGCATGGPFNGWGTTPEPLVALVTFKLVDPGAHYDPNRTVGYDHCAGALPIEHLYFAPHHNHSATTSAPAWPCAAVARLSRARGRRRRRRRRW